MGPGTELASNCFGVDSGGDAAARRSRGYGPEGRTAALTLPLGIDRCQDGTRCPNLFKTADYPLLVTGDLEVGKPETTRIKSRRIAISSTKWRKIAIMLKTPRGSGTPLRLGANRQLPARFTCFGRRIRVDEWEISAANAPTLYLPLAPACPFLRVPYENLQGVKTSLRALFPLCLLASPSSTRGSACNCRHVQR